MRRIHLPPLQTLRAFETAVRNFTRAADELALTQGAVSQHIRALEAQLGYPLFTRERNGATPTHAAHALQVRGPRACSSARSSRRSPCAVAHLRRHAERQRAAERRRALARARRASRPRIRTSRSRCTRTWRSRLRKRDRIDVALRYGTWPGVVAEADERDDLSGRKRVPQSRRHRTARAGRSRARDAAAPSRATVGTVAGRAARPHRIARARASPIRMR